MRYCNVVSELLSVTFFWSEFPCCMDLLKGCSTHFMELVFTAHIRLTVDMLLNALFIPFFYCLSGETVYMLPILKSP